MSWFLLLACSTPSEQTRWRQAVEEPDLETAKQACLQLDETEHQAECMLDVLEVHGQVRASHCEDVPAGIWNEECWFRAAEHAEGEVALRLCEKTDELFTNCMHHQLQLRLTQQIEARTPIWDLCTTTWEIEERAMERGGDLEKLREHTLSELWRLYALGDHVRLEACSEAAPRYQYYCEPFLKSGIHRRLIMRSSDIEIGQARYCQDGNLDAQAFWAADEGARAIAKTWLDAWCGYGAPHLHPDMQMPSSLSP